MNLKKAKELRKRLGLKLPIEPELVVAKEVDKITYVTDDMGGTKAIPSKRKVIINKSKYQYRQLKKMLKGAKDV